MENQLFNYYLNCFTEAGRILSEDGGIVRFHNTENYPIFFIADIHGRPGFVFEVWKLFKREYQKNKDVKFVFLGDYMHGEARAKGRWLEISKGNVDALDEEMHQNLQALSEVCWMKISYPKNIVMLRGNHDFMQDTFMKYCNESEVCRKWLYDHGLATCIECLEMEMSAIFVADDVIASHTTPYWGMEKHLDLLDDKIENRVRTFTWVNYLHGYDWDIPDLLAEKLLEDKFAQHNEYNWIVGHRPQYDLCKIWQTEEGNKVYQLNNPDKYTCIKLENGEITMHEIYQSKNAKALDKVSW